MTSGYHRFGLGQFKCVAVNDGNFNYPLNSFFPDGSASSSIHVHRESYVAGIVDSGPGRHKETLAPGSRGRARVR
jgi:hypothetical protein